MGVYVNPGNSLFSEAVNSKIYVDKTEMIKYTNEVLSTAQKYVCVSRPRRFGKSVSAGMLCAYYSCGCDSAELFSGLQIAEEPFYKNHMNQYNVIFLNLQDFLSRSDNAKNMIDAIQEAVRKDLNDIYNEKFGQLTGHISVILDELYAKTGKGFVVILDEWDCIFREKKQDVNSQEAYLDFLRTFLKDKAYVKLAYMTGILPIKKYGTHSALNMFDEFTMTDANVLAEYTGFTEIETKKLCEIYDVDYSEMKLWYDGYILDEEAHIFSPKSVVDAIRRKKFGGYWTQTETYEALKMYIDMNFDGLRDSVIGMLGGNRCKVNPRKFQNDMTTLRSRDDVLTLLIHLGYLTYDSDREEVLIPNREVETEFANSIEGAGWDEVMHALSASGDLLDMTLRGEAKAVAERIDTVHMEEVSVLSYNNENSLSCVLALAYYSARRYYTKIREFPSGKGFADLVFLPRKRYIDKPALVVELKWDKSAEGAIAQIKSRKYIKALEDYKGNLLLVGISYDKKRKRHQCVIEKWNWEREI